MTNYGDTPNSSRAFDFRFDFTAGPVREFAFLWGGSNVGWDIRVFNSSGVRLEEHIGVLPNTSTGDLRNYAGISRATADIAFVTIYNANRGGDDIFFDTPDGRFHYQVTSLKVINPHEVGVMAPTRENVLTLITCFPFWVLGPAPDRFVVRASVAGGLHSTPTTDAISVNDVEPSAGFDGPPPAERSPTTARRPDDDQSLVRQAVDGSG